MKTLFTLQQLENDFELLLRLPLSPCEFWQFDARDITTECSVAFARADKSNYDTALHFFVNVLRVEGEQLSMDTEGKVTIGFPKFDSVNSLSEAAFWSNFGMYTHGMKYVPALAPGRDWSNRFIGAVRLSVDWNSEYAVAEYGSIYIAVRWSTSG